MPLNSAKPILYSTPMVQAIIREINPKSSTRRIIKPAKNNNGRHARMQLFHSIKKIGNLWMGVSEDGKPFINDLIVQPRYQPGDLLWVRETWADLWLTDGHCGYVYKADERIPQGYYWGNANKGIDGKWQPSIFMPRDAARIFQRVVHLRAERLQNITEEDAKNEGVMIMGSLEEVSYRQGFNFLWDDLNAKRGHGWDNNDWVWVIEFNRPWRFDHMRADREGRQGK